MQKKNAEYEEFQELIKDIIKTEIQKFVETEYIFRGVTGKVIKVNENNTYSVDIVTTVLNNIENRSGAKLSLGDSVTLLDRYGSNYSNCFIFIKNGHEDLEEPVNIEEVFDNKYNDIPTLKLVKIIKASETYSPYHPEKNFIIININNNDIEITEKEYPTFFDNCAGGYWTGITDYKNSFFVAKCSNNDEKNNHGNIELLYRLGADV